MKDFFRRAAAFFIVIVYSLAVCNAADYAGAFFSEKKTLDLYLERAKINSDQSRFEEIAQAGIGAAVAEWESRSLELKAQDEDEWLLQKSSLLCELNFQRQESFDLWLLKKRGQQKTQVQKTALYSALKKAAASFYYTESNGAKTRIVSTSKINDAKTQWGEVAEKIVQEHLDLWQKENPAASEVSARQDFLSIENEITSLLVEELLYDHSSLKKASDDQAAFIVAQNLSEEVETETASSMEGLFAALQKNYDASSAQGEISQKEVLEKFQIELESGLEKWNQAERDFLTARMEWESGAEDAFSRDNENWTLAYEELEKRKGAWTEKITRQIRDGEKKWADTSDALKKELDEYLSDFSAKLLTEENQKKEIVSSAVSAYSQCRDILVMAQAGVSSWYARWSDKYNGIYSYWKSEPEENFGKRFDLNVVSESDLIKEIQDWKEDYVDIIKGFYKKYYNAVHIEYYNFNKYINETLRESKYDYITKTPENQAKLKRVTDLYNLVKAEWERFNNFSTDASIEEVAYLNKFLIDNRPEIERLLREYSYSNMQKFWDSLDERGAVWNSPDELYKWFDLYNEYKEKTSESLLQLYSLAGSSLGLQNEAALENQIIKVSALESYWKNTEEIYKSVYEYSKNATSSAESAAATKRELNDAIDELEVQKRRYSNSLDDLNREMAAVSQAQENYNAALSALQNSINQIQSEQEKYNLLYTEWSSLHEDKSFERILKLNDQLNLMEVSDSEFKTGLFDYLRAVQENENSLLQKEIDATKKTFDEGMYDAEHDAYVFSTTNLETLQGNVQKAYDSMPLDVGLAESLSGDFKKLDKELLTSYNSEIITYKGILEREKQKETELSSAKSELQRLEKERDEKKKKREEKAAERETEKTKVSTLQNEITGLSSNISRLTSEKQRAESDLNDAKAKLEYEKRLPDPDEWRVYSYTSQIKRLEEKIKEAEKDISEKRNSKSQKEREVQSAQTKISGLDAEISQLDSTINELEGKVSEQKRVVERIEGELEEIRREKKNSHERIKGYLDQYNSMCKKDLQGRRAILVLFDGTVEEIEEVFSNHDLDQIYNEYSKYSFALLNQKNDRIRKEVALLIANFGRENLSSFINELNSKKDSLNECGQIALDVYIKGLLAESANENVEDPLTNKINSLFEQKIHIKPKENHMAARAEYFSSENSEGICYCTPDGDPTEVQNIDISFLADRTEDRKKILSQIEEQYNLAVEPRESMLLINEQMKDQEEKINQARLSYENNTWQLRGDFEGSALNLYLAATEKYNGLLEESQKAYDQMEEARRKYRAANEIYFYAQNEYLHGNLDVKKEYEDAKKKRESVSAALETLLKIQAGPADENALAAQEALYKNEFDSYKESADQYYKAQVLLYEYQEEIAAQTERLFNAQCEEALATDRLVCEYTQHFNRDDFSVPEKVSDFLSVIKTEDAENGVSYSFKINSIEQMNSRSQKDVQENAELLKEYYTNFSEVSENVMKDKIEHSKAYVQSIEFLDSLEEKEYKIEDLALAFLYLKMQGSDEQRKKWLERDEGIDERSNYMTGNLPEKIVDVDVWHAFDSGRYEAVEDAYNLVMENGGEGDLAKYILFSETNFNSDLALYTRAHDGLTAKSLQNVEDALSDRASHYEDLVTVTALEMAAMTFASFFCGALSSVVAALGVQLVIFQESADKLRELEKDVKKIKDGYLDSIAILEGTQKTNLHYWKEAQKDTQAQQERLNVLYSGRPEGPSGKITWEDFDNSMNAFFESGNTAVRYSYFFDLHDKNRGSENLEELFEQLTNGKDFSRVEEVVNEMNTLFSKDHDQAYSALRSVEERELKKKEDAASAFYNRIQNAINYGLDISLPSLEDDALLAWGKSSFDDDHFQKTLLSYYSEDVIPTLPVRYGKQAEAYVLGTLKKICDIHEKNLLQIDAGEYDVKKSYADLLLADTAEQYRGWKNKIQGAYGIGQNEWNKAEEKIQDDYQAWQNRFANEYQSQNEDWEELYSKFILDKEEWISKAYSGAGQNSNEAQKYIGAINQKSVESLFSSVDFSSYLDSLIDENKFSKIASLTETLSEAHKNGVASVNAALFNRIDTSLIKKADTLMQKRQELQDEVKRISENLQAENIQDSIAGRVKDTLLEIKKKNKGMEDWELDLVRKAGYTIDSEIYRDAIVDSSLFDTVRRRQTVHRYQYFSKDVPSELNFSGQGGPSGENLLFSKVVFLQNLFSQWRESIFGVNEKDESVEKKGEFDKHVGEAARLIKDIDLSASRESNIEDPGSGQLGLIMLDFQWNALKNSEGYAELVKPVYEQKLFSTDCSWLKIPSLKDIASIVCDVIGNIAPVLTFVKYMDDAFFGTFDLMLGYKTFGEVLAEAAKSGLSSLASIGISSGVGKAFEKIGSSLNIEKLGKGFQTLSGFQNATTGYLSSVANSYVNAFDFARGTMNWEEAQKSWGSVSALTSAGGAILAGTLGEFNNTDANGKMLNSAKLETGIQEMNSKIGGIAGAALNYVITGDISFNLLNVNGVGLLEVGITDGEFGVKMGEGGVDVSLGAITEFAKGAKSANRVSQLKKSGIEGRVNLNVSNYLAWSGRDNNAALAKDIFFEKNELVFDDISDSGALSWSDGSKIVIDRSLLSDKAEDLALVTKLSAYQNALTGFAGHHELTDDEIIKELKGKDKKKKVSAAEIEEYRNQFEIQTQHEYLKDIGSASKAAYQILGADTDSAKSLSKNFEDVARSSYYDSLYRTYGDAGLYAYLAQSKSNPRAEERPKAQPGDIPELMEECKKYEEAKAAGESRRGKTVDVSYTEEEAEKVLSQNDFATSGKVVGADGEITVSSANVLDPAWRQNQSVGMETLMGGGLTKEEYNSLAKINAIQRSGEKEMNDYLEKNPDASEEELSAAKRAGQKKAFDAINDYQEKYASAKSGDEQKVQAQKKLFSEYGFAEQTNDSSLKNYGCTLSTAAYIAFSTTGKIVSLPEANRILMEKGIFADSDGWLSGANNGINEKNSLSGDSYLKAVNAIAGSEILAQDGINYQETNRKNIFTRLVQNSILKNDVIFTHMRTNEGHSVLFKSMTYNDPSDYNNASLSVLDPWQSSAGFSLTPTKLKDIARADFYKLTTTGKSLYNNTQRQLVRAKVNSSRRELLAQKYGL